MDTLLRNDVFEGKDGCQYRVVSNTSSANHGWVINLSQPHAWPVEREFNVLRHHSEHRSHTTRETLPEFAFYSEKARARANAAYEAIKPLVLNDDGTENKALFCEKTRSALVRARAAELAISKTTIYKYLKDWWTLGQTRYVLIPASARNGKNQPAGTGSRGRRPDDDRYAVLQMSANDIKWAKEIIQKRYIGNEHASLVGVHSDLIAQRYSLLDGNGARINLPEGERPSIHQLRSVLKKYFTQEDVERGKHGDKNFERELNPMLGSSLEECVAPGHIYEIDATILDVFLVAQANRNSIIGKPTLYLIYDRKTRLCVGFYLGLENASWTGMMLAILSIAVDKQALCRKYNVPYDPADWPAHGVFPAKFLADRGEGASHNSDRICDGMEATISNTQALLPIRKGLVESGFKSVHTAIKDEAPGYEPPRDAVKRRSPKYHLDAALTLDEIVSIILGQIVRHNRSKMRRFPLAPENVLDGWAAIPRELWTREVSHGGGVGTRYTHEYLHKQLLPVDTAQVTQQGITFRGCFYKSLEPTVRQWMVQAAVKKGFAVRCSYDLRLVDELIVHDSNGKSYTCTLTADSKRFAGYSYAEVKYLLSRELDMKKAKAPESEQARADQRAQAKAVVDHAIAATKAARTGAARSARRADTAAARGAEQTTRRREEVTMPPTTNIEETKGKVVRLRPEGSAATPSAEIQMQSVSDATPTTGSSLQDLLRNLALEHTNESTAK